MMSDKTNFNRRKVLKVVGGAGATFGAGSAFAGNVAAKEGAANISVASSSERQRATAAARDCEMFSELVEAIRNNTPCPVSIQNDEVYRTEEDGEEVLLVGFQITSESESDRDSSSRRRRRASRPGQQEPELRKADMAIKLTADNRPEDGHAYLSFETDTANSVAEMLRLAHTDTGVETERWGVEDQDPDSGVNSVTAQGVSCSACKSAYDEVCGGDGCEISYAILCFFIGGISGAACGPLLDDICNFIDENSCEAGLNEVVCQILGYCSTDSGEEPCEEYPGGVDSPYCDA